MNATTITLGLIAGLMLAAIITAHLLPSHGRHSNTLGPAHTGHETGAGPEAEYGWPLNTPAARAVLVDYTANLRQTAIDCVLRRDFDTATALNQAAAGLEAILRRWDIHVETA